MFVGLLEFEIQTLAIVEERGCAVNET